MSDTTSGESQTSVEGAKPPSTTSSWPITDIGGSEAGEDQSASVSPASSSLPPSPKLGEPASTETISSVADPIDPIPDAATELHGAGTSPDITPSTTTADKETEVAESQTLPVVNGDRVVPELDEQDAAEVKATGGDASQHREAASGDAAENTTTSVVVDESSSAEPVTTAEAPQPPTQQDKATEQDKTSGQSHPKVRPAFLLTRPTENGRNEEGSVPQPGSPSSTTPSREETPTRDAPANESTEGDGPSAGRPTPKITTLLSDIEQFSTSPVAVTATSPRTRAFFATDYATATRSPPRPGGAIITEISSDTEFTIVESKTERRRRALPELLSREAGPEREHKRDGSPRKRSDERAEGRPEVGRRFEPAPAGHSSSQSFRLPSVIGRTIVTAVPRLMRDESLRQQRLRDYDRQLEAERQREKMRILAERRSQQEERERQRQRERLLRAQALEQRQREEAKKQRAAMERPAPPAPTPPARETPLQALILELKAGLEADPAVYYAVRGVLHEYEEHTGRRPARASSVDEPSTRRTARQHERRREPVRQEQVNGSSRAPHRARMRVSFDEDTSTTERPPTLPAPARETRDHGGVRTALKKTNESGARSAVLPQHNSHASEPAEGGRLPHSDRPRAKPNTTEKPHAAVRRAAASEQDGRAAEKRSQPSSRKDLLASSSAALARAEKSRLQRRHSFDSIVDYKPTQGLKTKKKHETGAASSRPVLYDGPRGLMRAPTAEHATTRRVDVPTSISFSLADIQSVDGSSKGKLKQAAAPASGQAIRSDSKKSRQAAGVRPSTAGRSTVTRTSTVPYAQARWPARDDSITFDFDDFY